MSRIADAFSRAFPNVAQTEAPSVVDPWHLADEPAKTDWSSRDSAPAAGGAQAATSSASDTRDWSPSDTRYDAKLIGLPNLPAGVTEDYQALAANLYDSARRAGKRVLLVSSALPGEGKTLVASNLALAFSSSYGRRVLLIDCDLRRPSVHAAFGLPASPGLAESLESGSAVSLPVVRLSPTLSILVAGRGPRDPMRLVTGAAMQQLLARAEAEYDWVIVDSPPVGLLADATMLAAAAGKALLVIKAGETPYELVLSAIQSLGADRLLGCVLNQADATESTLFRYRAKGYGHYYQGSDPEP